MNSNGIFCLKIDTMIIKIIHKFLLFAKKSSKNSHACDIIVTVEKGGILIKILIFKE
jgi:hypothetical protein